MGVPRLLHQLHPQQRMACIPVIWVNTLPYDIDLRVSDDEAPPSILSTTISSIRGVSLCCFYALSNRSFLRFRLY